MASSSMSSTSSSSSSLQALIGPSLLACDLSKLAEESNRVLAAGADYLHVDVMDGHFVPNLTFGPPVIKSLRQNTKGYLDVHLMVDQPAFWAEPMADAGADTFTFHVETADSGTDIDALINKINSLNMKVGLALSPDTPLEKVLPYIDKVHQILVMTVRPGFGGQSFMSEMLLKVSELRRLSPSLNIQVDGGINANNIHSLAEAGANMIVAGTAVFKGNPEAVISQLKEAVEARLPK